MENGVFPLLLQYLKFLPLNSFLWTFWNFLNRFDISIKFCVSGTAIKTIFVPYYHFSKLESKGTKLLKKFKYTFSKFILYLTKNQLHLHLKNLDFCKFVLLLAKVFEKYVCTSMVMETALMQFSLLSLILFVIFSSVRNCWYWCESVCLVSMFLVDWLYRSLMSMGLLMTPSHSFHSLCWAWLPQIWVLCLLFPSPRAHTYTATSTVIITCTMEH
jgi:hypothetical protein